MALIRSIDGIGEPCALTLVLRMPELGSLSREEAAALLGVAPFTRESGQFKGERRIAGGRARQGEPCLLQPKPPAVDGTNPSSSSTSASSPRGCTTAPPSSPAPENSSPTPTPS
jgi:hypothetical protein